MTIRHFEMHQPKIAPTTYVDCSAVVIGEVTIGEDSSIWPQAVIRGDINSITIGARCSIQDGSVVHVTHAGHYNPTGFSTCLGNDITVGHAVVLHGCQIESSCLIGMNSCLMDGVVVESHVIIGAGSLVTPGTVCESGFLWMGRPARKVRALTKEEREQIAYSSEYYVKLKQRYKNDLGL